ncbi:hypothetical protein TSAR_009273 [Trichomalopsis sarcophagae]|uniref:Reverse transcriptase domain-containing protein n=1 Tax=Trichomalopsis sarcophagae TaxID=543379 RepID=A0A232ERL9_9HYME|nr:hypothetical protein TSAR_009273 [Trichomalopsis sarcophagae]
MLSTRRLKAEWGSSSKDGEVGIYAQAYADDIVLMVTGDDESVIAGIMQYALGLVEEWCKEVELGVNPNKVSTMLFTKRYKTKLMDGITLNGVNLKLVKDTKYLGVVLDPKLYYWDKHIKIKCEKTVSTF